MYSFRNLPAGTGKNKNRWYVQGRDRLVGSGILEWCYSESDANKTMAEMHKDPRFVNLSVGFDPSDS
jgi:hypothetical protein